MATTAPGPRPLTRTLRLGIPRRTVLDRARRPTSVEGLPGTRWNDSHGGTIEVDGAATGDFRLRPTEADGDTDACWVVEDGTGPRAVVRLTVAADVADGSRCQLLATIHEDGRGDGSLAEAGSALLYQLLCNLEAAALDTGSRRDTATTPELATTDVASSVPRRWPQAMVALALGMAALVALLWSRRRDRA